MREWNGHHFVGDIYKRMLSKNICTFNPTVIDGAAFRWKLHCHWPLGLQLLHGPGNWDISHFPNEERAYSCRIILPKNEHAFVVLFTKITCDPAHFKQIWMICVEYDKSTLKVLK